MKKISILFYFLFLFMVSSGQNFTDGFNFRLLSFDTTTQFFLPVFLNEIIDDTSFVKSDQPGNFTVHGKPVKFWGVNMVGRGFDPDKEDAPEIAGRMRKMGINIVRFNNIDNAGEFGLFFQTPDTRHINAVNLDKFEYFISQLKNNGIYIHITLEDLRPYCTADGVISGDSIQIGYVFNKAVPLFDPQLIMLQKEYAGQLLTHLNPYTGKSLINDPVLAAVEIVNENSLFQWWRQEFLKPIKQGGYLPVCYSRELDTLWNKFLKNKYLTINALTENWATGTNVNNPELLNNPDFEADDILTDWHIYLVENATAALEKDNTTFHTGAASAKIITNGYDGTDWHIMFIQTNFSLQKDTSYTVEFWVKTENNTSIQVSVSRQNEPYTYYGGQSYNIGTTWQKFRFCITLPENNLNQSCITVNPKSNDTIWIDDISLRKSGETGIEPSEDFNDYTVKRIDYRDRKIYSKSRISDLMEFYTKVQIDYFTGMTDYLKDNLGIKVPVEGTNYLVGPEDLLTLEGMDFVDNHAYWDHPRFSGQNWSSTDWTIYNESMLHNDSANTITYLFSGFQKKGKPFVIGEYNHLFPNRYQTECIPLITGYSLFQGADAIMLNDYNQVMDWELDRMTFYTTLHNNNAMMVNSPVFAYAFRNNLIKEADSEIELNYLTSDIYTTLNPTYASFSTSNFYPVKLPLTYKIVTASLSEDQSTLPSELPAEPTNPYVTSTGEIKWDTAGIFTIETDQLINFTGFLYNFPNKALAIATLVNADKFGTVTWLALDDTILTKSRKSLITISTHQQNTGMIWDGTTTVHDNWGTAPTEIEPMNLTLTLSIEADSIRIYPLNTLGAYNAADYYSYDPVSSNEFTINLDQNTDKTCWYGMVTFKNGISPLAIETINSQKEGHLENYPNPFTDRTTIRYNLKENSDTELRIFDVYGREVHKQKIDNESAGEHEIEVTANSFISGVYLYSLKMNNVIYKSKMAVIR